MELAKTGANYKVLNQNKLKAALLTALPLVVGGLSAAIAGDMSKVDYVQPPLSPPAWVFPVAWTVLYLMMGFASYLVYRDCDYLLNDAMKCYFYQLFVNFTWSIVFFRFEFYAAAVVVLIALLLLTIGTTAQFFSINKTAGKLMVPYIVWLIYALYLNVGVALLNR